MFSDQELEKTGHMKGYALRDKIARQIIRNSGEAIVILDKDRNIRLWNTGAERIFGYMEEDVLGKCIDFIIPENEKQNNQWLIKEVESRHLLRGIETKRVNKAGEILDMSVSITRVTDGDKFIGYLVLYVDITHHKKTSNELQKRFETIQDAYKELGVQRRQMDYIFEITEEALSFGSFFALCNLIVSSIHLLTKCDGVVLRTYDEKKDVLKLQAAVGVNKNWMDKSKIEYKNSLVEEAFNKKRALFFDNLNVSPRYKGVKLLRSHRFTSSIVMPLFVNDRLLGSLNLYAIDTEKLRLIETDFLENFAKHTSMAIFAKLASGKK